MLVLAAVVPLAAGMAALAGCILFVVGRVFRKAGQPAWAACVPFYNFYVIIKIVGRPRWWIVLVAIPPGTFVLFILVFDLAEAFGQDRDLGWSLMSPTLSGWRRLASDDVAYIGPIARRAYREAHPELRESYPHLDVWM